MGIMMRRRRRRLLVAGAAAGGAVAYHSGKKSQQQAQVNEEAEQADQASQATAYAPAPTQEPPSEESTLNEIEHLAKLHDSGALTDEEFAAEKAKLLGSS